MRVVLVEDHPLVRQLEADILSDLGYEVAATASAEEALQLLSAESATILITDIRLPGNMDGFALGTAARQRWPDLAIMLVGADVDKFAPKELEGIADEALSKPFRPAEFEQRVATLARIAETFAVRGTRYDEPHANDITAKEHAISGERARVRAWRMRAEELRATADSHVNPSSQDS